MAQENKPVMIVRPNEPEGSVAHVLCAKAYHLLAEADAAEATDCGRRFVREVEQAARRADVTYDDIFEICGRYVHIKLLP